VPLEHAALAFHTIVGARKRNGGQVNVRGDFETGFMSVTTISADEPVMTLVNIFFVNPEDQQELIDVLVEATDVFMQNVPGFISANIHRSVDGRQVVNYAQWQSRAHFDAMRTDPTASAHMERAADLAEFTPIVCEVVHVRHA
jgi:heme-degrading monooxygenase HmoA